MIKNISSDFIDFTPSFGFALSVHSIVTRLLDWVPMDARIHSAIRKKKDGYACSLEVFSRNLRFRVRARCDSAEAAVEKARLQLIRRVSRWHRERARIPSFA